jgi:hypothetical protein
MEWAVMPSAAALCFGIKKTGKTYIMIHHLQKSSDGIINCRRGG